MNSFPPTESGEILENIKNSTKKPYEAKEEVSNIEEEIAYEREKIKNKGLEQDINLKKSTLNRLFLFLGLETVAIFLFAFLQGITLWGFSLEEWSFRLLLSATIVQITLMLQVAVKHLFPTNGNGDEPKN